MPEISFTIQASSIVPKFGWITISHCPLILGSVQQPRFT